MSSDPRGVPANMLMKRSAMSFFTRRVLQRWMRGEIATETALELIHADDAGRLVGTWTRSRS